MARLLLLTIGLALIAGTPAAVRGQGAAGGPDAERARKSCAVFVQDFYDGYLRALKKPHPRPDLTVTYRPSALSPELLRQLKEDEAASARSPGEIVGLDFDPFLNAQDIADRYTAGAVTHRGDRYRVDVFATWSGKKGNKPAVVPELVRRGGRWSFVNFHYGSGKDRSDLLTILAKLRKERKPHR